MISFFYFLFWSIIGSGYSHPRARYFSLLAQRKVPKRKGAPITRPSDALNINDLLGCCATRKQRSDMLALIPRSFIYISARSKGVLKAQFYAGLFFDPRLSSLRNACSVRGFPRGLFERVLFASEFRSGLTNRE